MIVSKPTAAAKRAAKSLGCYGIAGTKAVNYAAKIIDAEFAELLSATRSFANRIANSADAKFDAKARSLLMDSVDEFQDAVSKIEN
jgi:hypothetical protein